MRKLLRWINRLAELSERRVEEYGARYVAFGAFSVANYLVPMYMWSEWHSNEVSVYTVRIIAILLSFMLLVSDSWYESYKKYRPLFWHFTVMFCLPFLVTFMTIFDGMTLFWVINANIAILLGLILLDFKSFAIIYPIGVTLGILTSYLLGHTIHSELPGYLMYPSFYMIIFVFVIVIIFSRDLNKKYNLQMTAMKTLAASIAHEVRTPLSTISLIINSFDVEGLPESQLQKFLKKKEAALKEVNYIFDIIEITLVKLAFNFDRYVHLKEFDAGNLIRESIEQYPFFENNKELIHINVQNDFKCSVNKELFSHVLFNLLQNALYQIKTERHGEIFITIDKTPKWNFISVKDTASGIKPEDIENIFRPFITTKNQGTGIGLYFCKTALHFMNASLYCRSVYKKYAEFIIRF